MTLVAFTIPDDPAALPGWLERRLVAPDFGRFVAELSAVFPDRGRRTARPATSRRLVPQGAGRRARRLSRPACCNNSSDTRSACSNCKRPC